MNIVLAQKEIAELKKENSTLKFKLLESISTLKFMEKYVAENKIIRTRYEFALEEVRRLKSIVDSKQINNLPGGSND